MRKRDLAERLAKETKVPTSAAADALDDALHSVIKAMRHHDRRHPTALQRLIDEADYSGEQKVRRAKP